MSETSGGLSFGPAAAEYDQYRPGYPPVALRWALGSEPLRVVDLGAGTGLLTRALVRLGHDVVPVEPDAAMRAELSARSEQVQPRAGSAEAIPLPDGSVDAVVAGQAYHWFDRRRAQPEIARILRPGGVFAPLWNIRDEAVPWVAELSRLANDIIGQSERYQGLVADPDFGSLFDRRARATFRHAVPMTADSLVSMMRTRSYYLTAPPAKQAALDRALRDLAADLPAGFDLPYLTVVHRAHRRSPAS